MKKITYFIIAIILFNNCVKADEGMWLPIFLNKYNISDMQKKGFKLTAEDIYSVNNASMKDAIVLFGRGCTGELVSDKGLLFTNHHCGYGTIQSHSSVENDLLTNGFWAKSMEEELANPGLTVTFLVRMEDVTSKVKEGIADTLKEIDAEKLIKKNIERITKEAVKGTHYDAYIRPFFYGNEYYLFVTEVFKDVRLVGAPPSAIGKFGGDTDNWMWPRHTGDFSVFRIYADKDNKPAEYSKDNVPYKPKKYFPISIKGINEGDFTMVFGFPGSTTEYLPSHAVDMTMNYENPHSIKLREIRLAIMKEDMDKSDDVRIKYSSKYAGVANYWKKWIGENNGLKRLNAIEKKQSLENDFDKWTKSNEQHNNKYGDILNKFDSLYKIFIPFNLVNTYFMESVFAIEIVSLASKYNTFNNPQSVSAENIDKTKESIRNANSRHFRNYNLKTDKKIFASLLKEYYENISKDFHPETFKIIEKKYKNSFSNYSDYIFENSIFTNHDKLDFFVNNFNPEKSIKILNKDPLYKLTSEFIDIYRSKIIVDYKRLDDEINSLMKLYVDGLRKMQTDKIFYPDANSTLRVAYGKVDNYFPKDAVKYKFYTTLDGIIEKDNPEIYDYKVPEKLKELYSNKDYGQYGVNGTMPVCFIASNHTTGGNSGSPVLNAEGQLIGINFDRNWEGTMSDIMYDPDQCRNIVIDSRYLLFIIEKFAGAKHLIDEMTIIK